MKLKDLISDLRKEKSKETDPYRVNELNRLINYFYEKSIQTKVPSLSRTRGDL